MPLLLVLDMPSKELKVPVQRVRIRKANETTIDTHEKNVEVRLLYDKPRETSYLCVQADNERKLLCNIRDVKLIDESSSKDMVTIYTPKNTVIIFYNTEKEEVLNFFLELRKRLGGAVDQPTKPGQIEAMINEIVESISTGCSEKAKRSVEQLAAHKINVQFRLSNKQVSSMANNVNEKSKDSDLELILQVEFRAPKEPIQIPITVHCGTTLRSIKRQVEREVGIECADQHWFTCHRYPLSDKYIFGSAMSIISNQTSLQPIQSGDTLYITGIVNQTMILDEANGRNNSYSNARLRITEVNPKLTIQIPPDNMIVYEVNLRNCSYVSESSSRGSVECIEDKVSRKKILILDNKTENTELLDFMRDYLTNPSIIPEPQRDITIDEAKVNKLITALNNKNATEAAQLANQLASVRTPVHFGLDLMNETGNTPSAPPPLPVEQPLKMKLSIESYLIDQCVDTQFDIRILRKTTIRQLKEMVATEIGINRDRQYWYINREHLQDEYAFGVSIPRIMDETVLILYIAKADLNV
ncbi:unnamed protein product [Adineta ricciae]|uniref:Ubiquitin-like domain-containing protein n=1 Tax=Adineta ricciae TaxID=249248 RepID=A0A814K1S8_ADIRI|nr:unnamed protein product [Adineta ricciae]